MADEITVHQFSSHLPLLCILVSGINSTLTVGFQGATNAAIPSMVAQDDLLKANGRIQASAPFATIIGPLLAGLLLVATSLQVVLWCDALTFVISAISLALIKTSFNAVVSQAQPKTSLRRDILDGLRYVLAQPVVRTIALFSLLANLALAILYPQIVFYAKQVLFASDAQVSLFFTAAGIGAVIIETQALAGDPLRAGGEHRLLNVRWRIPAHWLPASRLPSPGPLCT